MNRVYVGFGSNIGDRYGAVSAAFKLIEENGMKILHKSQIIETEPYGYEDQPTFINGVLLVETELSCREVLTRLLAIEKDLGRVRKFKWGPRIIDLDIIFFNEDIIDEEDLKVPHPDMQNRNFVLEPMNDICPGYVHPIFKKSIAEMLEELNKSQ